MLTRSSSLAALALLWTAGCSAPPPGDATLGVASTIATAAPFRVVGYATYWSGTAAALPYTKLTHINFAFALPDSRGALKPLVNATKLQDIVRNAHLAGAEVLLAVGGWSDGGELLDPRFEAIGANTTYHSDGTVSRVEFFANQVKLGEDAASPFSWAWTPPAPGVYALFAAAIDDKGARTESARVNVTVGEAPPPANVALRRRAPIDSRHGRTSAFRR